MRLRVAAALLALPVASAVVILVGGACNATVVHTWGAYPYDADTGCFGEAEIVDVVDGPDPGSCPVVHCWVNPAGDIFVTDKACDSPLDLTESTSGVCAVALKTFRNPGMCAVLDAGAGDS